MVATTAVGRVVDVSGQSYSADAWRRAQERAHLEGVKAYRHGGAWFATSVSEPGTLHQVNGACDCKGAQHDLLCKHIVAVREAQVAAGLLAVCDFCGRIGYRSQMHHEYRHVGGAGDVERWYCGEGYGHQVR